MFDEPDYHLTWPQDLFEQEARTLLAQSQHGYNGAHIELLLEEAFAGPAVVDRFKTGEPTSRRRDVRSHQVVPDVETATGHGFFKALIEESGRLREQAEVQPYFRQRARGTDRLPVTVETTKRSFARLVGDLLSSGYFERAMPQSCVDDPERSVSPDDVLAEALGVGGLWPLKPESWDDDTFYELVEVVYDLVARPRRRWWHDYSQCGWHYSDFAIGPARRLYRWRVNRLLDRSVIPYRLAESGEDEGRLVAVVDDARAELLVKMAGSAGETSQGKVDHAIALFRRRGATVEEHRSAVRVLADVLEADRALLKQHLQSKDEGDLFEIANRFAIRHNNDAQHDDYDPVFLDWLFWWYLATVELTGRLLARHRRS